MKSESVLSIINRGLLIVRVKAPFIKWIQRLPDHQGSSSGFLNEESVNNDPICFLIPNDSDPDDALEYYLPLITHEIFAAWCSREELWPKKFSMNVFLKWFDVTWATTIHDCNSKERLDYDE